MARVARRPVLLVSLAIVTLAGAVALAQSALAQLKLTETEAREYVLNAVRSMGGGVTASRAVVTAAPQTQQYPFNQRPTDVTVIMSTSRKKYDGTYTLSQTSLICGEVPKELNFSGEPAFLVQFPDGGDFEINDVTFNSKALVGGVTSTGTFHLNVSVKSKQIGHPAAYVLDTTRPENAGTATLTTPSAGTTKLKVDGVNDRGETVNLTVVCKPRQG
jgi:hypothetical protein